MGLTFFLLFRHFEFDEIWSNIHSASAGPLLIAVLMVPVYLLCYGGVMRLFLRSFGYSAGLLRCASYGCIDFYYSAITPSSTGGQPMVIYHMGKDGVPMSKSVLAPLVHTVLYKTVLILFTVAGLICYPGLVRQGGGGVFVALLILGAAINGLMLAACLLSMFCPRITKRIGGALIKLLGKEHTVILSTHILPEVQAVCDRIVVIDKGVIVANEKTEDLINAVEGSRRLIAKIVGPEDEVLKMLRATPGVKYAELLGRRDTDSFSYMLESEDKVDIRKPLFYNLARSGWPLIGLEGMELNIEDIFIRLIDRDKEKAKKGAKKGGNKQ